MLPASACEGLSVITKEELIRDLFNAVDIDHNKVISPLGLQLQLPQDAAEGLDFQGALLCAECQGYQEWLAATIGPGILDSAAELKRASNIAWDAR